MGIPKTEPSTLKINKNGIFKTRKRAIDKMISFCS